MSGELASQIRSRLGELADPARAPGQQAYMKSDMPFLGVRVPVARRIALDLAGNVTEPAGLRSAARELWDDAAYREERYAGMALLGAPRARGDEDNVALIEHMTRTGRWWDFTDELAHRVAELLDAHPASTTALLRRWCTDPDLWIRRLAILSQLGRRDRVDAELLTAVIEPNLADQEFFIRKAIGWALRDHARMAPDWVLAYVSTHDLSPLSRREALKHLG